MLGDKSWYLRALDQIKHRDGLSCSGGHMDDALSGLTNHEFGNGPEMIEEAEEWWEKHKDQTQEEWVREGFAVKSIHINMPPLREDWPKLLNVLGKKSSSSISNRLDGTLAYEYDGYLRYNAYRTLRDAEFDPVNYAIEAQGRVLDSEEIEGLRQFQLFSGQFATPATGTLSFAKPGYWALDNMGLRPPKVVTESFRFGVTAVSLGIALFGSVLVLIGRRGSEMSGQKEIGVSASDSH